MNTKWIAATVIVLVAGGLSACSTPRGYPYSATDCRYARPLPYQWVPNGALMCEHYDPRLHARKHYRHHRYVKHAHRAHPHDVYKP